MNFPLNCMRQIILRYIAHHISERFSLNCATSEFGGIKIGRVMPHRVYILYVCVCV